MYELSIAWSYLKPRWKQLSVSIISLISVAVIALVVWLILVFFSVTEGLEKGWMGKLTALTAPIRITPTEKYYNSYYHLVDSISEKSDFTAKGIREKKHSPLSDPYDPLIDPEIPLEWPAADRNPDGTLKDIVKETFSSIESVRQALGLSLKEFSAQDYQMATGSIRLRLVREAGIAQPPQQKFITQPSYIASFDAKNQQLKNSLLAPSTNDLTNILRMAPMTAGAMQSNTKDPLQPFTGKRLTKRLHSFFDHISISALHPTITPDPNHPLFHQWQLPDTLAAPLEFSAFALSWKGRIEQIWIPQDRKSQQLLHDTLNEKGTQVTAGTLQITDKEKLFIPSQGSCPISLTERVKMIAWGPLVMQAEIIKESIDQANSIDKILFAINANIQGKSIEATIPLKGMTPYQIKQNSYFATQPTPAPLWLYHVAEDGKGVFPKLPDDPSIGGAILVAKQLKEHGALLGDRGYISYYTPTTSSVQEQRIPVFIAGFYDPGIIPIGGKLITADYATTEMIRAGQQQEQMPGSQGIAVRFDDLEQAPKIKDLLIRELRNKEMQHYWKVETFREFDFSKEIAQQLQSEKNLFSLISMIIIVVACSNIISMLIILVNDKKIEIGILQAMGATTTSIAAIFGMCGLVMGMIGSAIGTLLASITMNNIDKLLGFIGKLQGFDVLNKSIYGEILPHSLSSDALFFVFIATVAVSVLAGLLPAIKAMSFRPAAIMRKE